MTTGQTICDGQTTDGLTSATNAHLDVNVGSNNSFTVVFSNELCGLEADGFNVSPVPCNVLDMIVSR